MPTGNGEWRWQFFITRDGVGGRRYSPLPLCLLKIFVYYVFFEKILVEKILVKCWRKWLVGLFLIVFFPIQFSFSEFIDDDRRASEIGPEEDEDDEDVEDEEDTVDGLGQQVPAGDDELVTVVRVLGGIGNYG